MAHNILHWHLPDATLCGEARGANPSTLFLHGFGGCARDWQPVWDSLDPALPVLRYDLRGFGGSRAHGDAPFSHSADLLALLDMQGIERADLVGLSMGGSVAVQFALDHPDRVRRLVLISTGLMGWDWSDEWRHLWRTMTAPARAGDRNEARRQWLAHPLFASTRADPRAAAWLAQSVADYSGAEWIADHQRPVLPDVERLPMLVPPTLLLSGGRDLPDFHLIADLIAGSAPDVRRIDWPDHGHMLTLEAPMACAKAIGPFLSAD